MVTAGCCPPLVPGAALAGAWAPDRGSLGQVPRSAGELGTWERGSGSVIIPPTLHNRQTHEVEELAPVED